MQIAIGTQVGYQAGAGGEAGTFDYLINDTFSSDLSAGNLDDTDAEPGPGKRQADDSGSRLSIASGELVATSGGVNGNPKVYYELLTRSPGRILAAELFAVGAGVTARCQVGVLNDAGGGVISSLGLGGSGAIRANLAGLSPLTIGTYVVDTSYPAALIVRAVGYAFFVKMSGHWLLLWDGGFAANDTIYPTISAYSSGAWSSDYFRVPALRWLPEPLASDGFSAWGNTDGLGHAEGVAGGMGAGGDGLIWKGDTWDAASGVATNTPTIGSELATDGGFETWATATNLTDWTEQIAGSSTINREASVIHAGTYATRFDVDVSNNVAKISQNIVNSDGDWLLVVVWAKASVAGKTFAIDENFGTHAGPTLTLSTTYTPYVTLIKATRANTDVGIKRVAGGSASLYFDDISIKVVTLASLLASVPAGDDDVLVTVAVTRTAGTLAGLVIALDSATTPANLILAFLDGSNFIRVAKIVAGVYTALVATAITYSAGAELRVIKSGSSIRVYYNNALVGSELTIADAGIVNNMRHGLFSTDANNTFDNFTVYARGTDGSYDSVLDAI